MSNPIFGTEFDDEIGGFPGEDIIYAGAGNDKVYSGVHGGLDIIYGEAGNDRIRGNGQIYGGADNDIIVGNGLLHGDAGNDSIEGNGQIYGDEGDDRIRGTGVAYGGAGNDVIFLNGETHGGDGDDILKGSGFLSGDAGDDTFFVTIPNNIYRSHYGVLPATNITIDAGSGVDTLNITAAPSAFFKNGFDLNLYFEGINYSVKLANYYLEQNGIQVSKLEKITVGSVTSDFHDYIIGNEGYRHPT
ncbi:MAG: hypothetical protein KGQ41_08955, partial [Alphaproteobacteria bacterium]|nr:hypothetical protein [Alphaproteobacteria bacterium]